LPTVNQVVGRRNDLSQQTGLLFDCWQSVGVSPNGFRSVCQIWTAADEEITAAKAGRRNWAPSAALAPRDRREGTGGGPPV